MAITLLSGPTNDYSVHPIYPANNPIVFVFSATTADLAQTNFRYVMKLSSSTGTELAVLKQYPNPTNNFGIFDVSNILKSYVDVKPQFGLTGGTSAVSANTWAYNFKWEVGPEFVYEWNFDDNFFSSGKVGFVSSANTHYFTAGDKVFIVQDPGYVHSEYNGYQEVYYQSAGTVVINYDWAGNTIANPGYIVDAYNRRTYTGHSSSSTISYVIDSELNYNDFMSYYNSAYTLNYSIGKLYTNLPSNYPVKLENEITASAHMTLFVGGIALQIDTVKENGTTASTTASTIVTGNYVTYGIGPSNLAGAGVDFTDVVSYEVYTLAASGSSYVQSSEKLSFIFDNECSGYDNIEIMFKDKLGAFVTHNFNMLSREFITDIERKTFNKPIGEYISASNKWGYNSYDAGQTVYAVNRNRAYTINTNWITEEIASYLEELLYSNKVYARINSVWYPIIISDTNFEKKTRKNTGLIQYSLNFKLANNA